LSGTKISDASTSVLARKCPSLTKIDLLKTNITLEGVLTLAKHAKRELSIYTTCMRAQPPAALQVYQNVKVIDCIRINVVTQDGNEMFFKCKHWTPFSKLMNAFCQRQGVRMTEVRFLFDGQRLRPNQTPEELDMEDGDVIDVMREQMNVGEWTQASAPQTSAAELLLFEAANARVDSAMVLEIERTATGPHLSHRAPRASYESVGALLTAAQCAQLVAHTERMVNTSPPADGTAVDVKLDVKLDVTAAELLQAVGPGVLEAVMRLGATQFTEADCSALAIPSRIVLRRSAAADGASTAVRRIGWHRDWCRAVVSISLSDTHEGACLLFAMDGRVHCPARPVGSAVAHNQAAVHGVSAITKGVRYNLIATFGDPQVLPGVAIAA